MSSYTCPCQLYDQFPQPARPVNSDGEMSASMSSSSEQLPISLPQPTRPFSIYDPVVDVHVAPPTMSPPLTDEEEDREGLDGLVGFISELREKILAAKRAPVTVQKSTATTTTTRGTQGPVGELLQKLERFKIRTVDLGEVVKEEVQKR